MTRQITAGETSADLRKVYFHLVGTDGITPATTEAGGQPQISSNGGAWTSTGIGVLVAIGNGRYYATLTTGVVASAGVVIETRFKSATTAECPGDTVEVISYSVGDVTVESPVNTDGTVVTLTPGATYNSYTRRLTWSNSAGSWPKAGGTLAGATITLVFDSDDSDALDPITGTVVTASGSSQQVAVDLTEAQSLALANGSWRFGLWAELTGAGAYKTDLAHGIFDINSVPREE